jgi:hypothetical protein
MCDYSLEMYGSRPAREGEIYVTTRFPSGSIGFASAGDPRTAVCMQCDTKVMLTDIPPALQTAFRVGAEVEASTATVCGWRTGVLSRCRICSLAFAPMSQRCSSVTR